jgi:calmodulin
MFDVGVVVVVLICACTGLGTGNANGWSGVQTHASANDNWEEELREAFNHFDEDGSGTIDTDEIVHAMTKIGQKLTMAQAKQFVKAADKDGDGEIDYNEFVSMLTSGRG